MIQNISIGAVSYLNTKPMITAPNGAAQAFAHLPATLELDYPASIANKLLAGSIQVGLVPIVIVPLLAQAHIITQYGIACTGAVASVALYSNVPITQVTHILLDYQSRTSVLLLQVLCKEYWGIKVKYITSQPGYEAHISGSTAALVIGDRAFAQKKINTYEYDLGEAWLQHTGLPFVFAAWVSNVALPKEWIKQFETQLQLNIAHYFAHINALNLLPYEVDYLTQNIQYQLTAKHVQGMHLFLEKIKSIP